MHRLAIGTIFRDEARFLREWLEYHMLVGVDHFFMLQNDDPGTEEYDHARAVLAPYVDSGVVTRAYFPDRSIKWQSRGWDTIISTWGADCRWLVLTDLDNFLLPMRHDSVPQVLDAYDRPSVAGLVVYYCTFGDSHLERSPALQTESLVWRAPLDARINHMHCYIIRPELHEAVGPDERYTPVAGTEYVDTSWAPINRAVHKGAKRQGPMDVLRSNHYTVRSREDWARKAQRGLPKEEWYWKTKPKDPKQTFWEWRLKEQNHNDERDTEIHRFLPRLKERMGL